MNTLSYKTQSAKPSTVERKWHIIDVEGLIVGRMATKVATVLRGKHKTDYTPHFDNGDYVIVINAEKVRFTGLKMDQKTYLRHTGYPGGQRATKAKELMAKKPIAIVETAIKGMLPKTKLGRAQYKKLFVYAGSEHPHVAQQPATLEL